MNGVKGDYDSVWELFDTISVCLEMKQWMMQLCVPLRIYKWKNIYKRLHESKRMSFGERIIQ